jgi:hypothetical protein
MLIAPRSGAALRTHRFGRASARQAFVAILMALAALLVPHAASAQTAADSSLTVSWTASGDDGSLGTATYYDLRYRPVAIAGTDTSSWWAAATRFLGTPTPHAAGATDSVKVTGLSPLTTYYFILRVGDEVPNWSGFSNVAALTTTGGGDVVAPAAIADLTVTGTTGTSMSVRWTAPGDNGTTGTARTYDIRYSTSAINTSNWGSATQTTGEPAPAVAGTQQTFTITGLNSGRTYYVAMRATDAAGNVSGISNIPSGTTLDTVAPAPVRDLSLDPDSGVIDPIVTTAAGIEVASDAR